MHHNALTEMVLGYLANVAMVHISMAYHVACAWPLEPCITAELHGVVFGRATWREIRKAVVNMCVHTYIYCTLPSRLYDELRHSCDRAHEYAHRGVEW